MNLADIDFKRLQLDLTPVVANAIEHLLQGAREDIEAFASDITRDLVEAQMLGDDAMKAQLVDQLLVLGEINNIRLRNSTWLIVSTVVSSVIEAAVAGALAAFL